MENVSHNTSYDSNEKSNQKGDSSAKRHAYEDGERRDDSPDLQFQYNEADSGMHHDGFN